MVKDQETFKKLTVIGVVLIIASILFGPGGGIVTVVALAAKLLWLVFLISLTIGLFVILKNNLNDERIDQAFKSFVSGFKVNKTCSACGSGVRENFAYCPSCGRKIYADKEAGNEQMV